MLINHKIPNVKRSRLNVRCDFNVASAARKSDNALVTNKNYTKIFGLDICVFLRRQTKENVVLSTLCNTVLRCKILFRGYRLSAPEISITSLFLGNASNIFAT